MMIRSIAAAIAVLCLTAAHAQLALPERVAEQYSVHAETTLAGAGYAITLQPQSATVRSSTLVLLVGATAYCPEACTLTAEMDSTPATATLTTATPVAGNRTATKMNAYIASNASGGTVVERAETPGSEIPAKIDLTGVTIPSGSLNTKNVTVRISSVTGDARLTLVWREY